MLAVRADNPRQPARELIVWGKLFFTLPASARIFLQTLGGAYFGFANKWVGVSISFICARSANATVLVTGDDHHHHVLFRRVGVAFSLLLWPSLRDIS